MKEKRIQFNNVIQNQLPQYVREEFPLVAEFLKQYYISQEFQGSSTDLIQNIDQYIKLDNIKQNSDSTILTEDVSFLDDVINVESTNGFPDSYGLIQIDDEIITYTDKTNFSFTGCIRGFSGVTSYNKENKPDQLVFKTPQSNDLEFKSDESSDHIKKDTNGNNTKVINLSSLFLKEFFNKIKYQLTPGFENREFYSGLDEYFFLKQSKDFYSTRGTDLSFKILFNVLYGEEVKVIRPQEYLIKPSDSQYEITNDLVVESISGDPYNLERSTLIQDPYGNDIPGGYASISRVEKIFSHNGEKVYYKLSFDAGYNKDITFDGSLYGNFSIHPKTRVIGTVTAGSNTIDVDSTVGFPLQGNLYVIYTDGSEGIISYKSKNLNQFFDCENIIKNIEDTSDIWLNVYAYGTSNENDQEIIKVRITSVLENVDIIDNTYYQNRGETSIIKTLGVSPLDNSISNNWFFNISTNIEALSIELINSSNQTYRLVTKTNHRLRKGDDVELLISDGTKKDSSVSNIISSNTIEISGQGLLDTSRFYSIKRKITKVNSAKYSSVSNQIADIQNVYKIKEKTLVSSASLPFYNKQPLNASDRSITFSGTFIGNTFNIVSAGDHGFYSGDAVYYTSSQGSLFSNGIYFIQRVNETSVRFAKSRSNLYNSIFISLEDSITVIDSKLEKYDFYNKTLDSQKLLREIDTPINDGNDYETLPGPIGILINGVEILNYKSKDKVNYGPLESIDVINSGFGYDVINPPSLIITDSVGFGATGNCAVRGSLQEIRIVNPGFDYTETPKIVISGGNGIGAKAKVSMKSIENEVSFNAESKSNLVNLTNNIIGFTTFHKFRDAERVIYKTNSQQAVGGIVTNSSYYVSIQDLYSVKLHNTFDDALVGVNTVSLTSYGIGNHFLSSYNKKSVISSINVDNSGNGYENKKRTTTSSGISTSLGTVFIKNHDFNSGEIVKYSCSESPIGGLVNNQNYYLTKVDGDIFKLSLIGVETGEEDFYYRTNQYVEFNSVGSGIHTFNYPEINVQILGNIGVSTSNTNLFEAVIQPIFRGEITSIHLEDGGVGYGSSEIINFNRKPIVSLNSGSEAEVIPVINNGKIVDILINNPGTGYNSPPDLIIIANNGGQGAVLTPILENGRIKDIKIIESGANYDPNNTYVLISTSGSGADLNPQLKSWNINLFGKYLNQLTSDDGFIYYNPNSKYGLQYTHLYAPRKLRENVYSRDVNGKILFGNPDLRKNNGSESLSNQHSPIIGWAYDGNPIYGPYGFSKKDGGSVTRIKSGYSLLDPLPLNRPPFPEGFFVEDYEYRNINDDSSLDEYNGRFCVTPDFPDGTYAYFATIDASPSNSFDGYRLPVFPYLIGNKFKSKPNEFNFRRFSNQDDINLNETNWSRNTTPYELLGENTSYQYVNLPNNLDQTVNTKYASPGSIEKVGIITGGNGYKVNDRVVFDDAGSNGFGFLSRVSRIKGKSVNNISVASTTIYNVEIYPAETLKGSFVVQSNSPHSLKNLDIVSISGINTTASLIDGFYQVGVSTTNTLAISNTSGIGSVGITGIVTYFSVSGNLALQDIKENDIFSIGSENVKVLNVDRKSSRIRVLRSVNSSIGSSHSYSDILYELPRRFFIKSPSALSYGGKINKEIYFEPKESLGIGTFFGVGIGNTIHFSNPGVGITQIFIPTKSIYLPNHNLETGDRLTYFTNSGSPITVSYDGNNSIPLVDQTTLYVAKISNDLIGISTVLVGLGSTGSFVGIASTTNLSTTLYFVGVGTGTYHSFKTNHTSLIGQVSRNSVTVSLAQTHGLSNNDTVYVNVNSGISTTYIIKYDDYNRKVLVNPRSFTSGDVNVLENSITIPGHNFQRGQKVLHTSIAPSGGLSNNEIYYVVIFDSNTIKLSPTYFDTTTLTPDIVGITSASSGVLSPINPPINVYKNSTVIFDLSDSSLSYLNSSVLYSAFDFNFYTDSNFKQLFDKTKSSTSFEVKKFGSVGIDTNAHVSLAVNNNVPQKLYYKLDPVYSTDLPITKKEVNVDSSVILNNQIQINSSLYSGTYSVISISSTSFVYNTTSIPEYPAYSLSNSEISYETDSLSAFGPVSKVDITSNGQNYYSLPSFSTIISDFGSGAILESFSEEVGKIKKMRIKDIGYDFPSDFTLRPSLSIPQVLKIEPLNSLGYIGISSVGRGYLTAPKLIVFDGKTQEFLPEINLNYSIGDTQVKILNNTYRLNSITPTIIPIQNSNGVGINSISYNPSTKDVTITLSVGFSTANSFPFSIGDRILIENISVGIQSTGKGYNSENYNYKLFTVTSVDENLGGIGSIVYNLNEDLKLGEFPGTYDNVNSSGIVVPEKYFPKFNIILKPNYFLKDEEIKYPNQIQTIGNVENWNERTKYLNILSREILEEGNVIEGKSSKTQGRISSALNFDAFINLNAYSRVERGSINDSGFLNNEFQRIQDNFYYQKFSYSLKSKVPYDTWENAVGSLNHTTGFKKFSDYQLESFGYSGIKTDVVSSVDSTTILDGLANLNCYYDFDLAKENALTIGSRIISDEITFSSRILTDYFESIGNRVLFIDDISGQFNSNPRSSKFSVVHRFPISSARGQKYITYVKDRRYINQRQIMLVTLLHDNNVGYLNQYGRVESDYDLGSFDFSIEETDGLLLFYPIKYKINDYDISILAYNLKDNFSGVGSTSLGNIVYLNTDTVNTNIGPTPTTIASIGATYTSAKILVNIDGGNGEYQFDELSIVRDGTNVETLNYGRMTSELDSSSVSELGDYNAYISGSEVKIDFVPTVGIAASVSTIQVAIANTSVSGVGTFNLRYSKLEARSTSIASSISPSAVVVGEYSNDYEGGYFISQVSDITNSRYQLSEIITLNDGNDSYHTEFGNIETHSGLGTFGTQKTVNSTRLLFTPLPNIEVDVKTYLNTITNFDETNSITEYNNQTLVTDYGIYYGTERDIRKSFELKHKGNPIFQKYFNASDSSVVSVGSSTIRLENHFFVTGEKISYSTGNSFEVTNPIGIGMTDFGVGIGTTNKLPSTVYVIKVDDNNIKLARSAEDALKIVPKSLNITSVGTGTNHSFTSFKQNAKSLITIDNNIQSPIVSTSLTSYLSADLLSVDDVLYSSSTNNFLLGDLIKIDNEIMKIESVGVGSTNIIRVLRPWLGTEVETHFIGTSITKIEGNYNIVENVIHFADAPYGNVPFGTSTNSPDERDWLGISTSSSFHGRIFMRSGAKDSSNETYYKNYVFDDISSKFDGYSKTFTITSNNSNIIDIEEENAIILVNEIFQEPGLINNFTLSEGLGITSITFVGTATSIATDVNTSNLPTGGIIVSIGSTEGFGYQPLISAGGTAVVSISGTISSISIGNSGSGYRSFIETPGGILPVTVRVGVATSSIESSNIEFIGTASVSDGNIVSIAITNPGTGYTSTNPPYVIIDSPLSYSDIPLIYSSSSSGIGTNATIDVVVGQGSSIIDFEIKNTGYGYDVGDILTIPFGGSVGIPTILGSTINEFQITIQNVDKDKFSGWSVGELEVFDSIEDLFDGKRVIFPLKYNGEITSVYARKGSLISLQDILLVFINDIIQIPGEGYIFNGGSKIQFTEAPKPEDTCKIIFYKGSGEGIDVIFQDIVETVKIGDDLQLTYNPDTGQTSNLLEDPRFVTDVISIDSVNTNPYFGPGNTEDTTLSRPIIWCKQTEDLIINQKPVNKNRTLYEPLIYPTTHIIQSVGIGSTIIYVENLRPFFNPLNENQISLDFQNNITFISQDIKVAASATAIVSAAGTISHIDIFDGGLGYESSPKVTIQNPIGIGSTTSTAISSITSGIVTSISIVGVVTGYSQENPPIVLIEPPSIQTENNRVISYEGDFGIICGISTTSVGVASTGIVFDFLINRDSPFREGLIVGLTTVSGIQTGYYFVISNSNVGNGVTSLNNEGNVVGSGSSFLDGVYQVAAVSIAQTSTVGFGITYVAKVTTNVVSYNGLSGIGYSNYYGDFSWGRIFLKARSRDKQYNAYTNNGYLGISTSPLVIRSNSLKYLGYL